MKAQIITDKKCIFVILLLLTSTFLLFVGCSGEIDEPIYDNRPYVPDTPVPSAHDGLFVSEHGTMKFNGDGISIVIDFDSYLAELTGLPEGEQTGTYVFLSGYLPPEGSIPVRYDAAHEMQLVVGEQSAVIDMAIAAEDGSTATSGVGTVTPVCIPMFFSGDRFFSILFEKEESEH